jgi:hypothetical protein
MLTVMDLTSSNPRALLATKVRAASAPDFLRLLLADNTVPEYLALTDLPPLQQGLRDLSCSKEKMR